jgi:hypothetical protein
MRVLRRPTLGGGLRSYGRKRMYADPIMRRCIHTVQMAYIQVLRDAIQANEIPRQLLPRIRQQISPLLSVASLGATPEANACRATTTRITYVPEQPLRRGSRIVIFRLYGSGRRPFNLPKTPLANLGKGQD